MSTLLGGLDDRYAVEVVGTDEAVASAIARSRSGSNVAVVPRVTSKFDIGSMRAHMRAFRAADPDIVLVAHGQLYQGQYGIMAAALTRRPIVSVVHCVISRTDRVQTTLMRATSKVVARFVGVSDSVCRATEAELKLAPGQVSLIHNGVPEPALARTPPRRSDGGRRLIGCVGRLSPEKGYDVALKALVELPDCDLAFLGEGPELGTLQRTAASLGVNDRVRFAGWVPPPWPEHWRFDVLLVPSRYEGFGLVAVEAMLAGIPVVASDVAGLSEVLTDEKTGLLVEPDEFAGFVRATRRMLDDVDLRDELVLHAFEDARRRFSAATMIASYESLFDDVIGAQ